MFEYMLYYPIQVLCVVSGAAIIYFYVVYRLEKSLKEDQRKLRATEPLQHVESSQWDKVAFDIENASERLSDGLVVS